MIEFISGKLNWVGRIHNPLRINRSCVNADGSSPAREWRSSGGQVTLAHWPMSVARRTFCMTSCAPVARSRAPLSSGWQRQDHFWCLIEVSLSVPRSPVALGTPGRAERVAPSPMTRLSSNFIFTRYTSSGTQLLPGTRAAETSAPVKVRSGGGSRAAIPYLMLRIKFMHLLCVTAVAHQDKDAWYSLPIDARVLLAAHFCAWY